MTTFASTAEPRRTPLERHELAHGWILGIIDEDTPARPVETAARQSASPWGRPRFTGDCSCPDYCDRDHGNE